MSKMNAVVLTQPNAFEQYSAAACVRMDGKLLKFTKFGEFQAGIDGEKLAHGTELVAQMRTLQVGWVKWFDGRPAERRMGAVVDGFIPATRAALGDTDKMLWAQ